MRAAEIRRRLRASELVEDASLEVGKGARHVYVTLSPEGHEVARDQGWNAIERRLLSFLGDRSPTGPSLQLFPRARERRRGKASAFPAVLSVLEEKSRKRFLLLIEPHLEWFAGHFPEHPVLPGIVQVHWAACFSESELGLEGTPMRIQRLKFKRIVLPAEIVELSISSTGDTAVAFEYNCADERCSEGLLIYAGGSA